MTRQPPYWSSVAFILLLFIVPITSGLEGYERNFTIEAFHNSTMGITNYTGIIIPDVRFADENSFHSIWLKNTINSTLVFHYNSSTTATGEYVVNVTDLNLNPLAFGIENGTIHNYNRQSIWNDSNEKYGLVWHFVDQGVVPAQGTSTIVDRLGRYNGTTHSATFGPSNIVFGKARFGYGINLTEAYVRYPNPPLDEVRLSNTSFYISLWVNAERIKGSGIVNHLAGIDGVDGWLFDVRTKVGGFDQLRLGVGSSGSLMQTGIDAPSNTWHHYAINYDNETQNFTIYFDGDFVSSTISAFSVESTPTTENLTIGCRPSTVDSCLIGTFDEFRIGLFNVSDEWVKRDYEYRQYTLDNITINDSFFENQLLFSNVTSTSFVNPVFEGDTVLFDINISGNYNSSTVPTASFVYNSTTFSGITQSLGSDSVLYSNTITIPSQPSVTSVVPFDWNILEQPMGGYGGIPSITIGGFVGGLSTTSNSHTVEQYNLTGCSPGEIQTLNVSFRDEQSNASINVDTVSHWYTVTNNNITRTFSFQDSNVPTIGLCLGTTNNAVSVTADYFIQATDNPIYGTRELHVDGDTLNNITQFKEMYLLNVSDQTVITVNVKDQNGDNLEGYVVEAQRFDVANNTFKTVASDETDFAGDVELLLETTDVYYQFVVSLNGVVVKTTSRFKITSTTINLVVITAGTTTLENLLGIKSQLTRSLTYDKTNRIISLTWDDTSDNVITQGCLVVQNLTHSITAEINKQCSNNNNPTLTYTFPSDVSGRYNALFIVTGSRDGLEHIIETLGIGPLSIFSLWKSEGLFWGMIIIASFSLMAVTSPGLVVITGIFALGMMVVLELIAIPMAAFMGLLFIGIALVIYMRK